MRFQHFRKVFKTPKISANLQLSGLFKKRFLSLTSKKKLIVEKEID